MRGSFSSVRIKSLISFLICSPTRPTRYLAMPVTSPSRQNLRFDRFHHGNLDPVSHLDVVVFFQRKSAFVTFGHFPHVVLEPAERLDLALVNDDAVADEARVRVADHLAVRHVAAGD